MKEHDTYIVVMNLGTDYQMANLQGRIPNLKTFLKVLVATENSGYNKGYDMKDLLILIIALLAGGNLLVVRPRLPLN